MGYNHNILQIFALHARTLAEWCRKTFTLLSNVIKIKFEVKSFEIILSLTCTGSMFTSSIEGKAKQGRGGSKHYLLYQGICNHTNTKCHEVTLMVKSLTLIVTCKWGQVTLLPHVRLNVIIGIGVLRVFEPHLGESY